MQNEDLLITRGRYITLIEEQKKLSSEIKSFKRVIKSLDLMLDDNYLKGDNGSRQQVIYDAKIAINKIADLYAELSENQIKIEQIKPMTGF
jgi:hypothetical protein